MSWLGKRMVRGPVARALAIATRIIGRRRLFLVLGTALALTALCGVGNADATGSPVPDAGPGLAKVECFSDWEGPECQELPHDSLEYAADVAVSPDGHSVYTAATEEEPAGLGSDAITEFARGADGTLHPTGCFTFGGSRGCRAARIPLEGVWRLYLSPDGRDLYALADDGIAEFARRAHGRLHPIGCLAFDTEGEGTSRCRHPRGGRDAAMRGLAFSPDGKDLYLLAATPSDRPASWLFEFARRPDGTLRTIGCFGHGHRHGGRCPTVGAGEVGEPVVSADGRALYAVDEKSLLRFPRSAGGSLGAPECVLGPSGICGPTAGHPGGEYLTTVALSADGSRLYLGTTRATIAYSVSPGGALTKLASVPVGAGRLVVAPDGSRVYGAGADSIEAFSTAGGGLSTIGEPYRYEEVLGIAVTPDGSAVLAAAWRESELLVLSTPIE